ncbi:MAG: hypothetical protein R3C31_15600 [Hyphomonadaceae bacterium]|nr:hypothetical protein U91I_01028 [alpha proteobacterium U9-1i]
MKPRRTSGPSRRALIAGAAAAPLIAAGGASPTHATAQEPPTERAPVDPAVDLARECLALHRENERLHRRWGDVEAWLADNHDWFKLTEEQQRALPEARKLNDIDRRFAALKKERPRAMRRLRRTPAKSLAGAMGKLRVVVAAIEPDEFPSAYRLLKATIRDLSALERG